MGSVPTLLISITCSPPGQQSKLLIKISVESRSLIANIIWGSCKSLWRLSILGGRALAARNHRKHRKEPVSRAITSAPIAGNRNKTTAQSNKQKHLLQERWGICNVNLLHFMEMMVYNYGKTKSKEDKTKMLHKGAHQILIWKVFGPKLPVFSEFILSGIGGLTTIVITIGPYDVICGAARMIGWIHAAMRI